MDLQNLFYIVAIIFMLACSVIFITAAIFLWHVKNKLDDIQERVEIKLQKLSNIDLKPTELLVGMGSSVATTVLNKFLAPFRFFKTNRS